MDSILNGINEWIKNLLIDGVMNNIGSMFDGINDEITEVASQVGLSPTTWNTDIYNLIRNLSDSVIMPIAGLILTFVMCNELIQMIIDRNNLHDFPPSEIFKWIMKTFIAVTIVTNTFSITMAIFDVSQHVVNEASGLIITDTALSAGDLATFRTSLEAMSVGSLLGLYLQSFLVEFCIKIMSICIFVIVYGRMIEIYLMTSLGAIPLATMGSREWNMGNSYIKSMCALAFQAFLIMVCMGIYAVLAQSIVTSGDPMNAIWKCVGYTVLLCFALFKTGALSKQIFSTH